MSDLDARAIPAATKNCEICGSSFMQGKDEGGKRFQIRRFCCPECAYQGRNNNRSTPESFWDRALPEPNSGCWLWTGPVNGDGYGKVGFAGAFYRTHRLAFHLAHGPVPAGLSVRHACDTPCCINPDHLCAGTHADNMEDMKRRGRRLGKGARANAV